MTGLRVCTFAATVVLAGAASAQCPLGPVAPANNHGWPGNPTALTGTLPITVVGDTTVADPDFFGPSNFDNVVVADVDDLADWETYGISNDGWWIFTAPADGQYTFSTCGTDGDLGCHLDTQLKLYTVSGGTPDTLFAGNDDNCDTYGRSSEIQCITLDQGEQVIIAVDGWQEPGPDEILGTADDIAINGTYELVVSDCEPCAVVVECPIGGIDEEEECGLEQNNLGCFGDPGVSDFVVNASCGDTVCGTLLRELGTDGTTVFIDLDTIEINVPSLAQIVASADAEFPIEVGIINLTTVGDDPYNCANEDGFLSDLGQGNFECSTAIATSPCVVGPVRIQLAPARDFPTFFSCDQLTWGADYAVTFECIPCVTDCEPEGDIILQHQADADLVVVPFNSVACNAPGLSGQNSWGRGFPVTEDSNVLCVEVGVQSVGDGLANGNPQRLDVNVYQLTSGTFPNSGGTNLTLLGGETFFIPIGTYDSALAFTYTTPVPVTAGTTIFVAAEYNGGDDLFPDDDTLWYGPTWLGSNENPETGEDYFKSDDCGIGWFNADGLPELAGLTTDGQLVMQVHLGSGTPCPQDLTGDNVVNSDDLFNLLGAWGACPGCPQDLTGDNVVNSDDLFNLLGAWGACP
jgi:hypothetical protein